MSSSTRNGYPYGGTIRDIRISFHRGIRLTISAPLRMFNRRFRYAIFISNDECQFVSFRAGSFLLFRELNFCGFNGRDATIRVSAKFSVTVCNFITSFRKITPFRRFVMIARLWYFCRTVIRVLLRQNMWSYRPVYLVNGSTCRQGSGRYNCNFGQCLRNLTGVNAGWMFSFF